MRAAESGDRAALSSTIAARERAGDLSNGEAAALAKTVASREIVSARGDDGLARVRDVRPCAHELDDALADRGTTRDAAGAEATLARVDALAVNPADLRSLATDKDDAWRALGARGLVGDDDGDARRRAMLDSSPLVRRQAVRASKVVADSRDLDALAEVARLDPQPLVRSEAVLAMARLPSTPNGRVANLLRDVWPSGDDGLREDIALAWSSPAIWPHGGREALRILVASAHGSGVIEGAPALLRASSETDRELSSIAVGHLARAIATGPRRDRLEAIALAPIGTGDLRSALEKAAQSDDRDVRVAALARLLEPDAEKRKDKPMTAAEVNGPYVHDLEALAAEPGPVGSRARFALAAAGDVRVQAWLERDLSSPDPSERLSAVNALGAMGRAARGAPLLADPDPSVRTRAACTLILAARAR
jgi:HEAT repeat protein